MKPRMWDSTKTRLPRRSFLRFGHWMLGNRGSGPAPGLSLYGVTRERNGISVMFSSIPTSRNSREAMDWIKRPTRRIHPGLVSLKLSPSIRIEIARCLISRIPATALATTDGGRIMHSSDNSSIIRVSTGTTPGNRVRLYIASKTARNAIGPHCLLIVR